MSESTTTEATGESGRAGADADEDLTMEAAEAFVHREVDGVFFLLALVAAGVWWETIGPLSATVAALGLIVLSFVVGPLLAAVTTKRWSTTDATVLESAVITAEEASNRAGFPSGSEGGYVPWIRYRYEVDGTTYENARISPFDGTIRRRRWAQSVVDRYPRNKRVDLRYDSRDPTTSYLQSWIPSRVNLPIPIALFFLAMAGAFALEFGGFEGAGGLVLLLVGALFALYSVYSGVRGFKSRRWPTTTGVVTGATVNRRSSGAGDSSGDPSYGVDLRYEYEVDGTTYVSTRYATGGRKPKKSSREAARAWQEEHYPVGGEVIVHYDPKKPDLSVLKPGGLLGSLLGALVALVFVAFGVYILLQPGGGPVPAVEELLARAHEAVS